MFCLVNLGITEIEFLQLGVNNAGDDKARKPFMICRDHIPGCPCRTGVIKHILIDSHIVIPKSALFGIIHRELPVFFRAIDPF